MTGRTHHGCVSLVVLTPSEGYAWCRDTDDAGHDTGQLLRYDGSTWQPLHDPAPPGPDFEHLTARTDGSLILLGPGEGAALEGGAWRTFAIPEELALRQHLPMGSGGLFGTNDGLVYLTADLQWWPVWLSSDLEPRVVQDLHVADGALFMPVWTGVLRGQVRGGPEQP